MSIREDAIGLEANTTSSLTLRLRHSHTHHIAGTHTEIKRMAATAIREMTVSIIVNTSEIETGIDSGTATETEKGIEIEIETATATKIEVWIGTEIETGTATGIEVGIGIKRGATTIVIGLIKDLPHQPSNTLTDNAQGSFNTDERGYYKIHHSSSGSATGHAFNVSSGCAMHCPFFARSKPQ